MNELFQSVYELLYYAQGFSNDLFQENLYSIIGTVMLISCLVIALVYYYAIDHPRFSRWYHWLLVLMISAVFNFLFAMIYPEGVLVDAGLHYGPEYFSFSIVNAIIAIITFTILSFCIRWWSNNCDRTPIPL